MINGIQEELLNKGIIYFTGEINHESMQILAEKLIKLDLNLNFRDSVTLEINSPGGNVAACFGVLDIIDNMRLNVNTVGLGEVCSCGLLLFLAGKHRFITKNTVLLSHQYFWGAVGKHHELEGARKEQDLCYMRMVRYYKERTSLSEKTIKEKLLPPTDVWLTTKEATKYNIATAVINKRKVILSKEFKSGKKKKRRRRD